MPLQVREQYQNPLTMLKPRPNIGGNPTTQPRQGAKDELQTLQQKRQSLQNEILLLRSTSDAGAVSAETQELLSEQLQEVTAQMNSLSSPPRVDTYTPEKPSAFRPNWGSK